MELMGFKLDGAEGSVYSLSGYEFWVSCREIKSRDGDFAGDVCCCIVVYDSIYCEDKWWFL